MKLNVVLKVNVRAGPALLYRCLKYERKNLPLEERGVAPRVVQTRRNKLSSCSPEEGSILLFSKGKKEYPPVSGKKGIFCSGYEEYLTFPRERRNIQQTKRNIQLLTKWN
jgi:hypothetical protein